MPWVMAHHGLHFFLNTNRQRHAKSIECQKEPAHQRSKPKTIDSRLNSGGQVAGHKVGEFLGKQNSGIRKTCGTDRGRNWMAGIVSADLRNVIIVCTMK